MSLKERLQDDWKAAMKAKDKFRANTISTAKSAVLLIEKTKSVTLDDEQIIEVLAKEIKQRREAILDYQKGNRQDLVDNANSEIEILLSYLPVQLTEEEIWKIVRNAAAEVGANSIKDMGKIMAAVNPNTKGKADGKVVSAIVREYLNELK